jgi:hypothetical protein
MAYIITSKTRGQMMRQPQEYRKVMSERRAISFQKHGVEKVEPLKGFSEIEIHE